jgi:hypothetical protein
LPPTGGGVAVHEPGQHIDKQPAPKPKQGGEFKGIPIIAERTAMRRLTEDELLFLIDYRRLQNLEKEKQLKFFVCIGDVRM